MYSRRALCALLALALSPAPALQAQATTRSVSASARMPSERIANFLHAWMKAGAGGRYFDTTDAWAAETWAIATPLPLEGSALRAEAIYLTGVQFCGTSGCDLVIVTEDSAGTVRFAGNVGLAQLPIRVLATHRGGWPDLGVTVFGGGVMRSHLVRVRSDGRRYLAKSTNDLPDVSPRDRGRALITDAMPETRLWPTSPPGTSEQRCLVVVRTTFGPMQRYRRCPTSR